MKLTQILHVLNEHGIPTIPQLISKSESWTATIKNRIYLGTVVAHAATKYCDADDMAKDRDSNLSYIPTAEILTDCFTKPLPKSTCLKQGAP
jgi:hypothetical protein